LPTGNDYINQKQYNDNVRYILRTMKYKQIIGEKQAVAGVIEALLLVALVAIVISLIQLQYIPQIMEQREAEHMDEVSNQFSYLKSLIDIQALTGSMGTDVPLAYVPMMAQITLGSRELPYFITAPAFGEISIHQDNGIQIETNPSLSGGGTHKNIFPLTSIKYDADNSYFVDQTYVLEGGGIILSQPDGSSVMRADPGILINDSGQQINVRFYLPNIIGFAGKNSTYGTGKCFVRTNYSHYKTYSGPIHNFTIRSNYLNAWNESLNNLFGEEIYNSDVKVNITGNVVKMMSLKPETKPVYLEITVVDIFCQMGPGWII